MGLYDSHILPHLLDYLCGMDPLLQERSQVVPLASGRVLEIGIGTGHNLNYYDPAKVTEIVGVDPAAQMQHKARKRAAAIRIPVQTIALELGQIQAPDASFDSIVCTFTLCTIPDTGEALKEMRRVLKPGGKLYFCEHGLAPDLPVVRWQNCLNPLWKPLIGGCNLNRDITALITSGGFIIRELHSKYLKGPRPMSWVSRGWAD